jgi:hypothetical protein
VKFNVKAHQLECQDSNGRIEVDAADLTKATVGESFAYSGRII